MKQNLRHRYIHDESTKFQLSKNQQDLFFN